MKKQTINITPEKCKHHIVVKKGYLEWHLWADDQDAKGIKQTICYDCGRWFYPEEMGERVDVEKELLSRQ
jgi:hypothetical protein